MADHIKARGGEVRLNSPVAEMLTNEDGTCAGYLMRDGTTVVADECATPLQPTALLTAALLTTALLTTALLTTALLTTYYSLPTTHYLPLTTGT